MNAIAIIDPPERRRTPAQASNRGVNLRLAALYQGPVPTQACFPSWRREAARLAGLYHDTGGEMDRAAFERHMGGMLFRAREERA